MPKKDETKETPKIMFKQIVSANDALYALDEEGRVFVYDERPPGWFQLDGDEVRELLTED